MVNLAGVAINSSPGFDKSARSARLTGVNLSVEEEVAWVPAVASLKLITQVESVTSPSMVNVPLPFPPFCWASAKG